MKPRIFTSVTDPALAEMILDGAVGVIPTDTVYGLVAKASRKSAIDRLYRIKPRHLQPGTTIGAAIEDFRELGFPEAELKKSQHYWPNPISVVMDATHVDTYLKKRRTDLPVRIPNDWSLTRLLKVTGALMTTSANAPGQPTATNVQAAMDYFGDSVDYYVDAGDLGNRPPSTIIGFEANGNVIVYRQGAVKVSQKAKGLTGVAGEAVA